MIQKHKTVITTVRTTNLTARAILITMTTEPPGASKIQNSYHDCDNDEAKAKGDTDHNDHRATW